MQQRLFEITYFLIARGHSTAGELADRFDVSTRTILRDIDALSSAGIPVYTTRGKEGGIHILPEYVVDRSLLTPQEQSDLLSQLQGLSAIGTPSTTSLLDKLSALFSSRQNSWLEVNFSPWSGGEETSALFELLRTAIIEHTIVSFSYFSSSGEETFRKVEPIKVVFRGQGWYLYAFCLNKMANRYFKLTRMKNIEKHDFFTPRELEKPSSMDIFSSSSISLLLRFPLSAAYRVYDEFPADSIEKSSHFLTVSCSFPSDNWLIGYLLSFGAELEVLSPDTIRDAVKEAAQQIASQYY